MKILVFFAVLMSKLCSKALHLMGRGATSLPGKVALKICPNVLSYVSKGVSTVVVTGTNGKTTTSRMLEECFSRAGLDYFSNRSGANLLSGVVAEFIKNSTVTGKNRRSYAIIECDEAAFRHVSRYVDAKGIVVTNIFSDQLDRFGQISHTIAAITDAVKSSPNATVCLNADCSITSTLDDWSDSVMWYGLDVPTAEQHKDAVSDAMFCIRCKAPYEYDWHTFGHLGGFRCTGCGYSRHTPDVAVTKIIELGSENSTVQMYMKGATYTVTINLPGDYNIYNAAAAASAAVAMGIEPEIIVQALSSFSCGFGRSEKITVNGTDLRLLLVKNPAGCNRIISLMNTAPEGSVLCMLLNDNTADGCDISWIWDTDFESLAQVSEKFSGIYVSGLRRYDMAMRLKYAGVGADRIEVEQDMDKLIARITESGKPVYVMPTYTAMLQLREKLAPLSGAKQFWE